MAWLSSSKWSWACLEVAWFGFFFSSLQAFSFLPLAKPASQNRWVSLSLGKWGRVFERRDKMFFPILRNGFALDQHKNKGFLTRPNGTRHSRTTLTTGTRDPVLVSLLASFFTSVKAITSPLSLVSTDDLLDLITSTDRYFLRWEAQRLPLSWLNEEIDPPSSFIQTIDEKEWSSQAPRLNEFGVVYSWSTVHTKSRLAGCSFSLYKPGEGYIFASWDNLEEKRTQSINSPSFFLSRKRIVRRTACRILQWGGSFYSEMRRLNQVEITFR